MVDYKNLSKDAKTAFWQEHINKWKVSGLGQTMYCRQNGLNKNAFTWRRRSLEGRVKPRITKVPSKIMAEVIHVQSTLELTFNEKLKITIDRDFDPELLQRLLKALGVLNDSQLA